MDREVIKNHELYCERMDLYKKFGYDVEKERRFIIERAEPLYGDILEIGTGKGHFTVALARQGYCFTTLDISPQEQECARQNVRHFGLEKQVLFKIGNAEALGLADKSFDIIFSVNMMHHVANPLAVISELTRVLSFEGKIIISDFTKEGLRVIDEVHRSEGSEHNFTESDLAAMEAYFISKKFRTERFGDKFQDILIAYHQLI